MLSSISDGKNAKKCKKTDPKTTGIFFHRKFNDETQIVIAIAARLLKTRNCVIGFLLNENLNMSKNNLIFLINISLH